MRKKLSYLRVGLGVRKAGEAERSLDRRAPGGAGSVPGAISSLYRGAGVVSGVGDDSGLGLAEPKVPTGRGERPGTPAT